MAIYLWWETTQGDGLRYSLLFVYPPRRHLQNFNKIGWYFCGDKISLVWLGLLHWFWGFCASGRWMVRGREAFWRLLVGSAFLRFLLLATLWKSVTCEILFRETNPGRDKNGTKPQENKIKNASSPTSLAVDFSFPCKGTILSREMQIKSCKYAAYQTFMLHGHFRKILQVLHAQTYVAYSKDLLKSVLYHLYTTALLPMHIALEQCTTHLPLSTMRNVCSNSKLVKNATWHNDRTKRHI